MKYTCLFLWFTVMMTVHVYGQVDSHFAPPVMGWSSWNTYRINISEDLIKRQADAMVSLGLQDVGYQYINIDDGFFGCRNSEGV